MTDIVAHTNGWIEAGRAYFDQPCDDCFDPPELSAASATKGADIAHRDPGDDATRPTTNMLQYRRR
ncbi:MAG: hypothetical protein ABW178_04880 [Pseudoxanthomonas sp.]